MLFCSDVIAVPDDVAYIVWSELGSAVRQIYSMLTRSHRSREEAATLHHVYMTHSKSLECVKGTDFSRTIGSVSLQGPSSSRSPQQYDNIHRGSLCCNIYTEKTEVCIKLTIRMQWANCMLFCSWFSSSVVVGPSSFPSEC